MASICKECGYKGQKSSPTYRKKKGETICPACYDKYRDKGQCQKKHTPTQSNRRWLGMRTRILLLFFFIPFILIMTTGYLFLEQLNRLSAIISDENINVVTDIIDEFTLPMDNLRKKAINIIQTTQRIAIWITAVAAEIVALTAIIYGNILSTRIKKLKNIADRISIGDTAAHIETKDSDELGDLAIAISRLQESIRLSLQRLRRRTNSP